MCYQKWDVMSDVIADDATSTWFSLRVEAAGCQSGI